MSNLDYDEDGEFEKGNNDEEKDEEENDEENDEEEDDDEEDYVGEEDLTEEENQGLCRAFTLLDVDGDGVIEGHELQELLISWGRLPMNEQLDDIMSHARGRGCEGTPGMDFKHFRRYIAKQLANTRDEDELRKAFQVFDSTPPTGKLNVVQLRHFLKHKGMKMTNDEIDFLYREREYWLLEEKNIFEYEEMINKILEKPTCNSAFLNCWK